jgi:hypothetical protein
MVGKPEVMAPIGLLEITSGLPVIRPQLAARVNELPLLMREVFFLVGPKPS